MCSSVCALGASLSFTSRIWTDISTEFLASWGTLMNSYYTFTVLCNSYPTANLWTRTRFARTVKSIVGYVGIGPNAFFKAASMNWTLIAFSKEALRTKPYWLLHFSIRNEMMVFHIIIFFNSLVLFFYFSSLFFSNCLFLLLNVASSNSYKYFSPFVNCIFTFLSLYI